MELKPDNRYFRQFRIILLLIVPYGIETPVIEAQGNIRCLLIVPYGIETEDCDENG